MLTSPHVASWYAASANDGLTFPALQGEVRADVCIVGGGYTGLSAAIHLRKLGYSVVLLEAHKVGWGASGRNGGQVGTGQRADQRTLEKAVGRDHARKLWELGLEAVATVEHLIDAHKINCELKQGHLHVAAKPRETRWLAQEVDHLEKVYNYSKLRFVPAAELSQLTSAQGFHGGILDEGARHLHPLNYALGLARAAHELGAALYEGTRAESYSDAGAITVSTCSGKVKAQYLVMGCNGYLENLAPSATPRIMPINNFMVATEPLPDAVARRLIRDDTSMSDSRFVINYWRLSACNRLLFGGGESYSSRLPQNIGDLVRKPMLRIYPELEGARVDYAWGGRLAITRNRLPDFGRLSANVFYAQGYSGHGLSIATLAGKLLAEVVSGSAERFDVMADIPSPPFPGGALLRYPSLIAGMLFYSLRDRLG